MTAPAPFRLYAIKYATHDRPASANLMEPELYADPHENAVMPLDYYVWAAVSDAGTVVIDTGFGEAAAAQRGRTLLRSPADGLRDIGIDAAQVKDVVITHMHYDHVGNFGLFPAATFHLQDREMALATGRYMRHRHLRRPYDVEDVTAMVRAVYAERVRFHDGDRDLLPGLSVHLIGGHAHGLQVVRAWTERGWVVLASDAAHFYANLDQGNPFPVVFHVGETLDGYERLAALADSPDHIIPGHDPLVLKRYPAAAPGLEGVIARVDLAPVEHTGR